MATELGKAYVQIIPSAKGISGSISSALSGESTSAGKSAGLNIAGAIKGAIAAAGIGAALKSALEAGGDLQQSFGGLDTLYGDAAKAAKDYAVEAAKAGISANDYAEQAVSFGASLKQAFGGDTVKAAEAANTAIMDMADNSAKMGTDITAVQTAYQGFAKQNYTMLDNLKLGYGGTKTEMERLLKDAQKLSGVKYDINNLGDVYSAIHVIQDELGLTGVAADEAKTTFTGSLGAMKAAGQNLLANLTLGEDIRPSLQVLGSTINTFLFDNLFPMIGNAFKALPDLLSGVGTMLIGALNRISSNAGEIAKVGVDIVVALVKAIVQATPYLLEAAAKIVLELGKALISMDWIAIGRDLIDSLKSSLDLASGEILGSDTGIIDGVFNGITNALPELLSSGVEIITEVANGILQSLPQLITTAGEIITKFASFIMQNYPTIMENGKNLLLNLVNGIVNNLPQIVTAVVQVIAKFVATVAQNLPQILQKGIEIIGQLVVGLLQAIPKVVAAIPQIISAIKSAFGNTDWASIGMNIIQGIKNGIVNAAGAIADAARSAAQSAFNAAKNMLQIHSPSKKGAWLGDMFDEGIALGIDANADEITKATDAMIDDAFGQIEMPQTNVNMAPMTQADAGSVTVNMTINGAEGQDINALAEIIQEKINDAVQRRGLVYA